MALKLTPVEPIGTRKGTALVCYSGGRTEVREVESPVYPPSYGTEHLWRLRLDECGLGLRDAAQRCGISPADFSKLERGEASCDWEELRRLLRASKKDTP
jgi:hypothetical protein